MSVSAVRAKQQQPRYAMIVYKVRNPLAWRDMQRITSQIVERYGACVWSDLAFQDHCSLVLDAQEVTAFEHIMEMCDRLERRGRGEPEVVQNYEIFASLQEFIDVTAAQIGCTWERDKSSPHLLRFTKKGTK